MILTSLIVHLISGAIFVPVAGKLSDVYSRKKILLLVLTIYAVGVVGGAVSTDIYSLLISRTVQGIGMSVFHIVFAIVQDQFLRNKIAIAQGTLASMFAFGGLLGLVVDGNIIEYFGWRAMIPFIARFSRGPYLYNYKVASVPSTTTEGIT